MNTSGQPSDSRLREIFLEALEKASLAERAAFLDGACGDDRELRRGVDALLADHRDDSFLEQPALTATSTIRVAPTNDEQAGTVIDRYKLLEKLGEGGFGAVWLAEQKEPVRRKIALKVIKLGMDTKQVVARFEAERQALALMDHPNIAKVLDAGSTDGGRPYFVMELVRGIPITKFCDENKLVTHERLDLFIKVCNAVQHAHQKGIIHRDLKPSNVLVTLHDGVPVPKVIDFGIAKATQQELTDKTIHTQFQQFIGTPAYVSPEQAEMSGLDIDTRSDIYSLGVLLYELLTGVTPFNAQTLIQSGLDEMRRIIREDEPKRPSTRLSTLAIAEATVLAKHRREKLPALIHIVRGDLDWIVMKCLEKDRARRYETASGLATDLKRHLNTEPVIARPPSRVYRFQKAFRRHKLGFAAGAAVVIVLLLGVAISAWQAMRATRAERKQADLAEEATRAKEREAKQRSASEQRLYDFLISAADLKRQQHSAGYRSEVFQCIRQALALDAPQKDPLALRALAMSCLGDVAGLTPVAITNFPANTEVEWFSTDASGHIGAFTLSDGTILLRKLPSGEEVERLNLNGEEPTTKCEMSEDGWRLVSRHKTRDPTQGCFRLWTRGSDEHLAGSERIVVPHVTHFGMLNNSPYVCTYDESARSYRVMDLSTQKVMVQLEPSERPSHDVWSASGLLLIGTHDAFPSKTFTLHVWDARAGGRFKELPTKLEDSITSLYASKDGRFLACERDSGAVEIRTLDQLELVTELTGLPPSGFFGRRASFSRNSALLAISEDHRRISLWNWANNRKVVTFDDEGTGDRPVGLEFVADDRYLIAVGNRQVRLYPVSARSERLVLSNRKAWVNDIGFSPDSQRFGSVYGDGQLLVGDVWTGRSLWETNLTEGRTNATFWGSSVSFSRDGLMAIASNLDAQGNQRGELTFWNEQRRLRLLKASTNEPPFVQRPEFTPDGRFLVASGGEDYAGNDHRVHVWRVKQPSSDRAADSLELQHMTAVGGYWSVMAVHNQHIAYASKPPTDAAPEIHLLELEGQRTDRILARGTPGQYGFQWLDFTPDARRLLVVSTNSEIVALDIVTGEAATPPVHPKNVPHAAPRTALNFSLSPDGSKLAVFGCVDPGSGVEIWDWKARQYLYCLPEPANSVMGVRWSPDSQHLAVCGPNETSIWHLPLVERVLADLGLFERQP